MNICVCPCVRASVCVCVCACMCVCVRKNMYFFFFLLRTILVSIQFTSSYCNFESSAVSYSYDIAPRNSVSYFTDQKLSKFVWKFFLSLKIGFQRDFWNFFPNCPTVLRSLVPSIGIWHGVVANIYRYTLAIAKMEKSPVKAGPALVHSAATRVASFFLFILLALGTMTPLCHNACMFILVEVWRYK